MHPFPLSPFLTIPAPFLKSIQPHFQPNSRFLYIDSIFVRGRVSLMKGLHFSHPLAVPTSSVAIFPSQEGGSQLLFLCIARLHTFHGLHRLSQYTCNNGTSGQVPPPLPSAHVSLARGCGGVQEVGTRLAQQECNLPRM